MVEDTEAFENCETECEQWDNREQGGVHEAHRTHCELTGEKVAQHCVQIAEHNRNQSSDRARIRKLISPDELVEEIMQMSDQMSDACPVSAKLKATIVGAEINGTSSMM